MVTSNSTTTLLYFFLFRQVSCSSKQLAIPVIGELYGYELNRSRYQRVYSDDDPNENSLQTTIL